MNKSVTKPSPIRHACHSMSRQHVSFWGNRKAKTPNQSQSVTHPCDGFVTDLRVRKVNINRYISSLSINKSRCHAHPRAMPAYAYERAPARGVTDSRDGLGTPGRNSSGDARGNSRAIEHSLFYLSEISLEENHASYIAVD